MPTIPKIIHFIWASGKKTLPGRNIKNIKKWANKNKEFDIFIWVDKRADSGNKLEPQYQKSFEGVKLTVGF